MKLELNKIEDTDYDAFEKIVNNASIDGKATVEQIHRKKNGTQFPAEVTLHFLNYNGINHIIIISRDISKRKEIAEELLRFLALNLLVKLH